MAGIGMSTHRFLAFLDTEDLLGLENNGGQILGYRNRFSDSGAETAPAKLSDADSIAAQAGA